MTLSERKVFPDCRTFAAHLHLVPNQKSRQGLGSFEVLDSIQHACVVIDKHGLVLFQNRHTEAFLGWGNELLGCNVSVLMPEPYSSKHDSYIQNFLHSARSKLIGRGSRNLSALRKDGTCVAVELCIAEIVLEKNRCFVGMLKQTDRTVSSIIDTMVKQTADVINNLSVAAIVCDKKVNNFVRCHIEND